MAVINRYVDIQPARYQPMSLQELMLAPQYKRQQHDALQQSIADAETNLSQLDPLDAHSELVQLEQQKIFDKLNQQATQLARQGFSPASRGDFIRLNQEYQKFMSPTGVGGKAQVAKQEFFKQRDSYIANATQMGYSPQDAAVNWDEHVQQYLKNYGETGNIRPIDPLYTPNYKNIVDETRKFAKEAGLSELDISELGSTIKMDDAGQYVVNTGSRNVNTDNIKQLEAVTNFMNSQVLNPNTEIGRSIQHQRLSPQAALEQVAGVVPIYQRDKTAKETRDQITNFKSLINANNIKRQEGVMSYTRIPVENIKLDNLNLVNSIDNTLKNRVITRLTGLKGTTGTLGGFGTPLNTQIETEGVWRATKEGFYDKLNEKQREQYDIISKGLRRRGILQDTDAHFGEFELKKVREYIENYQETLDLNNVKISSDLVSRYGTSIGVDNSNPPVKIGNFVYTNHNNLKFADPITKEIMNFNDLPDEVRENFKIGKIIGSGHYSPKSYWSTQLKGDQKDLFIAPLEVIIETEEGPKTLLVSRTSSEVNTPEYRADSQFNNIYTKTSTVPNLPQEFEVAGKKVELSKIIQPKAELRVSDPEFYQKLQSQYDDAVEKTYQNIYRSLKLQYPDRMESALRDEAMRYMEQDDIYVKNDATTGNPVYLTGSMLQQLFRDLNGVQP